MPAPAAGRPSTTSRLEATFARLRGRGERALVTYFTAGDPSLADTRLLVVEAERRGADVVELRLPVSTSSTWWRRPRHRRACGSSRAGAAASSTSSRSPV